MKSHFFAARSWVGSSGFGLDWGQFGWTIEQEDPFWWSFKRWNNPLQVNKLFDHFDCCNSKMPIIVNKFKSKTDHRINISLKEFQTKICSVFHCLAHDVRLMNY